MDLVVDLFNVIMGIVAIIVSLLSLVWFMYTTRKMSDKKPKRFFRWIMIASFFFTCYVIVYTYSKGFSAGTALQDYLDPIGFVLAFFASIAFVESAIELYKQTPEARN
ncbi:MAG: hypothetical protein Q7S21_06545 [archaeon]|nr:hypothetical protein [archaeon]